MEKGRSSVRGISVQRSGNTSPLSRRFGEYLVETGRVSSEDIRRAVRIQKQEKVRLGEALVRMGLMDDIAVARVLAEKSGCDFSEVVPEPAAEALKLLPERMARSYALLAVGYDDDVLRLACDRPLPDHLRRTVERRVKGAVYPIICPTGRLKNSIALAYTGDSTVSTEDMSTVEIIEKIIIRAVKWKASDIHIEPLQERVRIRYRIDGVLQEVESCGLHAFKAMISRIKVLARLNIAEKRAPQDGAISFRKGGVSVDLRVSCLPSLYGEKVVMRLLAGTDEKITLAMIGLSSAHKDAFSAAIGRPYGIVLIVGPTGSGKSTTLSAALHHINRREINIVTVEDPVEYKIPGITQVHVGQSDKLTFSSALRAILRQDPDVIMVGETRDRETAEISLRAALTGHMVFTTLHTNDAPGALPRLVDMGCEPFLVSSSVTGVLAQRLVRKLCPHCREETVLSPAQWSSIGTEPVKKPVYAPRGCSLCNGIGYKGRVGLFEYLPVTSAIQKAVMAGASGDQLTVVARQEKMTTLREDGIEKMVHGVTSFEEVIRVTVE
ncbi:GspE/PulE family protein [Chitinivibrio alkaliphilus]|uniref:Type IV-A pilus assembly ATPase PilB n=1 Tax=Chitinivibrio alkaliphilus ACht1 TaxID=1313304 RepID=U7D6N6_9BACT|nr:GspE/PulE family protein [Chitinivibrio alkaliphilus]ERP31231.1 type IV-A pilus assembly ATPase PilB [Chitinivibrio alkaliphilus ACht1]